MTVCIGAISNPENSIVMVADRMVSTFDGLVTGDNAIFKLNAIHGDWWVAFAGDTGVVTPILKRAANALAGDPGPTAEHVRDVLLSAYDYERIKRAEATCLGVFGHTMSSFLQKGIKQFGEGMFKTLCDRISEVRLDCDFLVCGFELRETFMLGPRAQVFTVRNGIADDFFPIGYWAIGSGTQLALGSLSQRQQSFRLTTFETVYNLCEARFVSESTYGVGRDETVVIVQRYREHPLLLRGTFIQAVKAIWKQHYRSMPSAAMPAIEAAIREAETRQRQPSNPTNSSTDQT